MKRPKLLMDALNNRALAIPIFLLVLFFMFATTLKVGGFLSTLLERGIQRIFIDEMILFFHSKIPLYLESTMIGVCLGIKIAISFLPIIFILYFFMTTLEESGYMTRTEFMLGKILGKLALPGRAVIPLILGFGCNVPAILATRIIPHKPSRIVTIAMIPFMSCGARLTVFVMFCSVFLVHSMSVVMLLYLGGVIVAFGVGYALKNFFKMYAIEISMEQKLPEYRIPNFYSVAQQSFRETRNFILDIGKTVIIVTAIVNLLNNIDTSPHTKVNNQISQSINFDRTSLLKTTAQFLTPALKPMGVTQDNWPAIMGLLSGVLAKEVILVTLNTIYAAENLHGNYQQLINEKFDNQASLLAYLLFILLYFPCISVFSVIKKELGSIYAWSIAIGSTLLAYAAGSIFYQLCALTNAYGFGVIMILNFLGSCLLIALIPGFAILFHKAARS